MAGTILILASGAHWEARYQASAAAAAAVAAGRDVEIGLFFGALERWVVNRWDVRDPAFPELAEPLAAGALPPLSELLAEGVAEGRIRLYACSASLRLLGLEPAVVQRRVDAILGWPSFLSKAEAATSVLSF